MTARRSAFLLAALIGVVALAVASGSAVDAASAGVAMRNAQFVPSSVTVNVGDSVSWTNEDGIAHSARADNGSFDTGVFSSGTRSATFPQAGTFGYFCAVHPSTMRGTVSVQATATPPPTPPPTAPPTAAPTPRPTARPSPPPPTLVPSTPSATASPSPTPVPSPPSETAAASPTATAVAVQISATPSPSPTADGSSRSGEGPSLLLVGGALVAAAALTGVAIMVIRRQVGLA